MRGGAKVLVCLFCAALAVAIVRPAAAQSARSTSVNPVDLSRVFDGLPNVFERVAAQGYTELFRLLENLELFRLETEIDRFVGRPRELNDTTSYKLSLLPFHIAYPIYKPLIAQMTRLDTVRANRIYTVTPNSVSLIDLRLRPVATLEEFNGLGRGSDIASSLLTHFSAREIADLTVFGLAQYSFFPETDSDWQRTKRRIARSAIPIALTALATGALFDAGALAYSGTLVRRGKESVLRYYGQFRGMGVHWHPYLRAGLTTRVYRFELAAGFADQINPTVNQPDHALEMAVRDDWLTQLVQPLGLDAFFEAALKRSIGEPAGFVGDLTTARTGFFFKRDRAPLFPSLAMRGSIEAESNLERRPHLSGALGFEKPYSGVATMLQASVVPAPPRSGLPDDARVNLFFVGSMEPLSQSFSDDMSTLAHQVEEQWEDLEALEKRRELWEQALLQRGAARRTPEEARVALAEMEQILAEREERTARLANDLADYLQSRRRAYSILGRARSQDDLHGPLDAAILIAARDRILARLQQLAEALKRAQAPLTALRARMATLEREVQELEASNPGSAVLAAHRQRLVSLGEEWERETERLRRFLSAHDQLHIEGVRILTETGGREVDIRQWDTLGALRMRVARLAVTSAP